jgi:tetratricopeptide (TPR) repeat protein
MLRGAIYSPVSWCRRRLSKYYPRSATRYTFVYTLSAYETGGEIKMSSRVRRGGFVARLLAMAAILLAPVNGMSQTLPKVTVRRVDLIEMLRTGRWDTLDAELSNYEMKAEKDPHYEMNAMVAFGAFDAGNPLISSKLNDWVTAAPNSYAALVARATCEVAMAQHFRGNGPAQNIPKEIYALVDKQLQAAVRDANEAIKIHPNLAPAYALQIKAARIGGSTDEMARAKSDALSIVPGSFAVREQIMYALRPRWGGSRQAMQQLADSSQYYAEQNPAMQFLKGWVALDEGDDFADVGKWPDAIDKYTQAIQTGGEYWTSYRRRAAAYYAMQQWQKAVTDGTRANDLYPENSESLRLLAFATAQLEEPEPSILYVADYMRFEMPEPELFALAKSDQALLKSQGKENW